MKECHRKMLTQTLNHELVQKSILHFKAASHRDDFYKGVRAATYGLWSGQTSLSDFIDQLSASIEHGFRFAWYEGLEQVGITPEDMNLEEKRALDNEIYGQYQYMNGFGQYVIDHSKKNKGKFGQLSYRMSLWTDNYLRIVNLAISMSKADPKLLWKLGQAEHCDSCVALNGKIKRRSYWNKYNLHPQCEKLTCRKHCRCSFIVTNDPLTRGRLPVI